MQKGSIPVFRLKRAAIAAAMALGLSVAMITPASAATAPYDCGSYGLITVNGTRVSPKVRFSVAISFFNPAPIAPGGFIARVTPQPGPIPPFDITNTTVIPAGFSTGVTLTGTPAAGLLFEPDLIQILTPLRPPCTRPGPGIGWPI